MKIRIIREAKETINNPTQTYRVASLNKQGGGRFLFPEEEYTKEEAIAWAKSLVADAWGDAEKKNNFAQKLRIMPSENYHQRLTPGTQPWKSLLEFFPGIDWLPQQEEPATVGGLSPAYQLASLSSQIFKSGDYGKKGLSYGYPSSSEFQRKTVKEMDKGIEGVYYANTEATGGGLSIGATDAFKKAFYRRMVAILLEGARHNLDSSTRAANEPYESENLRLKLENDADISRHGTPEYWEDVFGALLALSEILQKPDRDWDKYIKVKEL